LIIALLILSACKLAYATVVRPTSVPQETKTALAYDGSSNIQYVGKALSPCATSEDCWQISKLTYSGSDITDVKWAGGTFAYVNVWDNRTSYVYS
jgi:hypothetical protein